MTLREIATGLEGEFVRRWNAPAATAVGWFSPLRERLRAERSGDLTLRSFAENWESEKESVLAGWRDKVLRRVRPLFRGGRALLFAHEHGLYEGLEDRLR